MMKTHHTATLLFVLVLLFPCAVFSAEKEGEDVKAFDRVFGTGPQEEDVYRSDRLLVSATGSLKPVHLAPSVATVITSEDIEKMGATTLDEILETVPGLHVSPSGQSIFSSTWSIRGILTSINPEALLLVNGIPVTITVEGGRLKTFNMPVAMISRVEVVRGPGSAVHGADAFAGTINVITKDGHEIDGTKAGLRYGSFDMIDGWVQHGGTYGGWNIVTSLEARKSDGDTDRIVEQDRLGSGPPSVAPYHLDTRSRQVDFLLGANKDDQFIATVYGSWFGDNGVGAGGLQALTHEESNVNGRQLLVDLQYNNQDLINDWNLSVRVYYIHHYLDVDNQLLPSSYINMVGNPFGEDNDCSIEVGGVYSGFNKHTFRLSVGMKYYDTQTDEIKNFGLGVPVQFGSPVSVKGTPYIFMDDQHRFLWYASIQDEWTIARGWELTAGIRYDEYDDFGGTINPRLALVWEARYDLTAKLLYGRAFRAPSFSELYYQANPVIQGNDQLTPETIETYELAFDWQPTSALRIIPSVYNFDIDDAIEFVGPLPSTAENYARLEGTGFEVEVDWKVTSSLQLRANLAYQRSKNKQTKEVVPDTPSLQFLVGLDWAFMPDWSLGGQYSWIGGRHRANGDPRPEIDDYGLVNLTLRRENLFRHCDAAFAVRNVFDVDAREPSPFDLLAPGGAFIPGDYPMEGRSAWIELRFHF